MENNEVIEYKGYYIEFNFYGMNEYSVQYCGDDYMFSSFTGATKFVDEICSFMKGERYEQK